MQKVLITGSGKKGRTGHGLALHLGRAGYEIILHYRKSSADTLETIEQLKSEGLNCSSISGDLSNSEDIKRIEAESSASLENLYALIHTVGNYDSDIEKSNLITSKNIVNLCLPYLKKSQSSRIILFGTAGLNKRLGQETENLTPYCSAKMKLLKMTKQLAIQEIKNGLTVNMVSPGEMQYSIVGRNDLPMGRKINISEIANACMFFLDSKADSIIGQNLEVAGGLELI